MERVAEEVASTRAVQEEETAQQRNRNLHNLLNHPSYMDTTFETGVKCGKSTVRSEKLKSGPPDQTAGPPLYSRPGPVALTLGARHALRCPVL